MYLVLYDVSKLSPDGGLLVLSKIRNVADLERELRWISSSVTLTGSNIRKVGEKLFLSATAKLALKSDCSVIPVRPLHA